MGYSNSGITWLMPSQSEVQMWHHLVRPHLVILEYNPYHGHDGKFASRGAMSQARTYKQAIKVEKEYKDSPAEKKARTGRKILRTMLGVAVGASIIAGAVLLTGPVVGSLTTAKIAGTTYVAFAGPIAPIAGRVIAGNLAAQAYLRITRRPRESEERTPKDMKKPKLKGIPMKNMPLMVTNLKSAFDKAKTDKERDKIMKLSIALWKEIAQHLPS